MTLVNLKNKDFSNFDSQNVDFTNADLSNSILDKMDLRNSDLSGSKFFDSRMKSVTANGIKITEAQLIGVDFSLADFSKAFIQKSVFNHCIALEVNFSYSFIDETYIEQSNLNKCDFSYCKFENNTLFLNSLKATIWKESKVMKSKFYETKFFKAKFSRGKFEESEIINSNLTEAFIEGVEFINSNLSETDFSNTVISNCSFVNVNFHKCNLTNTVFRNVDFKEVSFEFVTFSNTTIAGCDISNVTGLESIRHLKPSTIGIDTIYRSQGKISRKFLQECGLQEILIDYIPSLVSSAENISVDYYSCFLSHSHEDKIFVRKVFDYFKQHKIRCWLDEKQILPGDDIYDSVDKGIRLWDKFIVCLSKTSLNSYWVEKEIEKVLQKEEYFHKTHKKKVNLLIPINIDNYINEDEFIKQEKKYESDLRKRNIADLTKWNNSETLFKTEMDRVVRALQTSGNYEDPPVSKL